MGGHDGSEYAAKRGDGALLHSSGLVAIGLDELDVAAASGGGELDMHDAATLTAYQAPSSLSFSVTNVPPQRFRDRGRQTRAGAGGTFRKGAKIGVKCRTPVVALVFCAVDVKAP